LLFRCEGGLLVWTWLWFLRCNRRQGSLNLDQAGFGLVFL
jgi:hypothetical protein